MLRSKIACPLKSRLEVGMCVWVCSTGRHFLLRPVQGVQSLPLSNPAMSFQEQFLRVEMHPKIVKNQINVKLFLQGIQFILLTVGFS